MSWYRLTRPRACEADECGAPAWRACRLCGLWICRWHRWGAGAWFRCGSCSSLELALAHREHQHQADVERRQRHRENARFRAAQRCRVCSKLMSPRGGRDGITLWSPSCTCNASVYRLLADRLERDPARAGSTRLNPARVRSAPIAW